MAIAIAISLWILHRLVQFVIFWETLQIWVSSWSFLIISRVVINHSEITSGLLDTYSCCTFHFKLCWFCTLIGILLANTHINVLLPWHLLLIHYLLILVSTQLHSISVGLRSSVADRNLIFNHNSSLGILLILFLS